MAEFKVGSLAAPGTTGTQAISGVGFTPKAIVFWTAGNVSGSGTWDSDIYQAIGFTSGAAESFSVAGSSQDGVATSNTGRRIAAKVVTISNVSGTGVIKEADLTSFDADGFTLDWTTAAGSAQEVMFLAIGGDDVNAKVINWTSPTATGNKSVTGVGFEPDVVLHAGALNTALPDSSANFLTTLGAMTATDQWTNGVSAQDAQATADTHRYQRTDKCLAHPSAGSVLEEAAFSSMDADGFTVNFTKADSSPRYYISLALSGVDAKVGNFAKTTDSAPASQAITGVGFEPRAVLLTTVQNTASASVGTQANWGLGAADGTNERASYQSDWDNLGTTNAESLWTETKALYSTSSPGATGSNEADLSSFDAGGFTLNWTANLATADEILYLAFGSGNTAPNTPTNLAVTSETTDTTPVFEADISDPDTGQDIKARFKIYESDGTTLVGTIDSSFSTGSHTASVEYSSALPTGEYKVEAATVDDVGEISSYTAQTTFYIKTSVSEDLGLVWDVNPWIEIDLALVWNVTVANQKDLELKWNVYSELELDLTLQWSTYPVWTFVDPDPENNPVTWDKVTP